MIILSQSYIYTMLISAKINHLMGTLKLQGNGPLYSNTVTDWYNGRWWVGCYIWYREEWPGRAVPPPSPLLVVPNVTAHPSTASVPTSYYSIVALSLHCKGLTDRLMLCIEAIFKRRRRGTLTRRHYHRRLFINSSALGRGEVKNNKNIVRCIQKCRITLLSFL